MRRVGLKRILGIFEKYPVSQCVNIGVNGMKKPLTKFERQAVLSILNERLAGGVDDLRDALGLSKAEAARYFAALERVSKKL
jgi:hypothetical protein